MENVAGIFFLIGLMGTGKTTQGKRLADRLACSFADTDQIIVRRTGVAIATIFEIEGEEGFRKRETEVLDEFSRNHPLVLSTGGGAVLRAENRRILRERGTAIYLHTPIEVLEQRLCRDTGRPLLRNTDVYAKLAQLYQERDPLYRATAHHTVYITQDDTPECVTRKILRALNRTP